MQVAEEEVGPPDRKQRSGARGSSRAAGLSIYEGPTLAHVTRWAGLILRVL